MRSYFNGHNHTEYSNIRLLDCINHPIDLINKAIELGLSGIAITDHECLSSHMEINKYAKELQKTNPNFVIGLGNEIYLTENRDRNQKYYHFILIAKDEIGHRALREMSTIAWKNSYVDRKMERVPLLKSEMLEVMNKYKGHVIATTACMGGELGQEILLLVKANREKDKKMEKEHFKNIYNFINYCKDIFKDDFYLECAPSDKEEQILINQFIRKLSIIFNVKITLGTDSHYLTKKDRSIHKAYLNSKNGDREIDDFYEFTYLMDSDECEKLLNLSFNDMDFVNQIFDNTQEIQNKITFYSLERNQIIPKVEVKDYPRGLRRYTGIIEDYTSIPIIESLLNSNNIQERYWINECLDSLIKKNKVNKEYLNRIEIEADVIKYIGEKLNDCLFAYFNTFKHYIDLFWECGSIVGPGRGSATGFLSNYLLGITQLDPIRWDLKYWRFLNKERVELPSLLLILGSCKKSA